MLRRTATHAWIYLRGPRPRWFGHPAAIPLIAGLLIADYISIPGGYWRGGSTVKTTIEHLTGQWSGVSVSPRFFPGIYMHKEGEIELIWETGTPMPGHLTTADMAQPGGRIDYTWQYLGRPRWRRNELLGFYHITHRKTNHSFDPKLSPEQASRMMALFIERSKSIPPAHEFAYWSPDFADVRRLYAQGKTTERMPITIGYYRNAIALTLLALLILAYARGRTDLWLKSWRDRLLRRPKPWQCQSCGYDIQGLTTCPECGRARTRA